MRSPATLRRHVCALLHMTDTAYQLAQFELGMQYLEEQLAHDPQGRQRLCQDARYGYWAWWRHQWRIREDCWLALLEDTCATLVYRNDLSQIDLIGHTLCRSQLRPGWLQAHSPGAIAAQFAPLHTVSIHA